MVGDKLDAEKVTSLFVRVRAVVQAARGTVGTRWEGVEGSAQLVMAEQVDFGHGVGDAEKVSLRPCVATCRIGDAGTQKAARLAFGAMGWRRGGNLAPKESFLVASFRV